MSKLLDKQKADHAYRTFIKSLRASGAQVAGYDDPFTGRTRPVSREAMLNAFLKRNPQHEEFRERLAEVYSSLDTFPVDAHRWKEVAGE